jgi:type II secretory pathway component PulM
MSPETNLLQDLLRRARSRRQLLLSLRGGAISLGVVAVVLLLTGWGAHRYRYNTTALIVLRIGALLTCLATIYFALLRPLLKRISDARLARLIEEHSPGTEDRLVTAVEFSDGNESRISPAIMNRL